MSIKATGLTVDGVEYNVLVEFGSLGYSVEPILTENAETIGGKIHQKQKATRLVYSLTIDPRPSALSDYETMRALLTDPASPEHLFTFKHNGGTLSFNGVAMSGSDEFRGIQNGAAIWGSLSLVVEPTEAQITI